MLAVMVSGACEVFAQASLPQKTIMSDNIDEASQQNTTEIINEVLYDYEVFTNNKGLIDCTGTLKVIVNIPDNCTKIVFYHTKNHLTDNDKHLMPVYGDKDVAGLSGTVEFSRPNISWGTYFRVQCFFENGSSYIDTEKYCTNSYLSEKDRDLIFGFSNVDDAIAGDVSVSVVDGGLSVITMENTDVTVVDMNGNNIFTGAISRPVIIPLDRATSSVIIVRYRTGENVVTKKIQK